MSFFTTSENEKIQASGEFESGGGNMEPIPNNTDVLAAIDEAGWTRNDTTGEDLITLRWNVLAPKEYANRKIWQRLRVLDDDDKKADKAKRMLAAIDTNAGGKLLASGEQPDDAALMKNLMNKPMVVKAMLWEMKAEDTTDGQARSGNWISKVAPRKGGAAAQKEAPKKPEPKKEAEKPGELDAGDYDDDIGF